MKHPIVAKHMNSGVCKVTNDDDTGYYYHPVKRLRGGGDDDDDEIIEENNEDDDLLFLDDYHHQEEEEEVVGEEGGDELIAGANSRWCRPPVDADFSNSDINFQWMDIDMTVGPPLLENPNSEKRVEGVSTNPVVPILRLYGVNEQGNSVAAFIHGFTPYGYFAIPDCPLRQTSSSNTRQRLLEEIRTVLNSRLKQASSRGGDPFKGSAIKDQQNEPTYCVGCSLVTDHKSIMGFETPHQQFLKVFVALPTMIPTLKRIMEEGITLPGLADAADTMDQTTSFPAFECNVPFILRYMIDHNITGSSWVTLPNQKYQVRRNKQSHAQIEVDVTHNDVIAHKPEGQWNKIAPFRVLSMDIECQGRKGHFPEAHLDPVIQIANVVCVYGTQKPIIQNVFTLKGCLPIVGAQVIPSETEGEMLLKWRAFLQASDVDIITGYNVQNFDIPYLLDRADALIKQQRDKSSGNTHKLQLFKMWGRIKNQPAKMKDTTFQSAAFGKRNNVETTIDGRVVYDMLPYMQRNVKLSSYSLNSVCAEFLGQQKEDVHHSIISDLQNGSDEDRHRLAVYCLKDAQLPLRLMEKLSVLVNTIEMARVTGVPINFLISRGQQIKVLSMLLRKCRDIGLLIPTLTRKGSGGEDTTYEGATVLDPIKGYYQVPIATLDFASLYPSIMQAYNLCYSTLVSPCDVQKLNQDQYNKSDNGHVFVKSTVKTGILPTILAELLAARKQAKKDMKNAETEFEKSVQNGRQLALKVSANSVYGFTGATIGQLPCLPIASSVTSYGRQLLEKTKAFVEEKYTISNGYQHDAQVIYGDTDSVMVKFGTATVKETFPLALDAAEKCSSIFPRPIQLEFEKVYFPYLLMNKKRYAGLMWTNVEKFDYMDTKGLETVRRDNCALVREVIQTSLDTILIKQDMAGAIDYVKSQISDLLQNKMDISRLVITKSLQKGAEYALGLGGKKEDYKVKQAHVELAARMKKRDAGSAPQLGDRVPYVIITGAKGAANFEKAEDPVYVLENNLSIDCKWYLSNQLSKPLMRIFEPIIDNAEKTLFQGEHTRKIFIPTPTARKGSLMMFAVKTATCVGCKATMDVKQGHICKHCKKDERLIYLEKLATLREAETRHAELWSAAQRIHGTVHTDIICTGDGCACQFYRRKKAQADIRLAQEVLDKFGR